LDIAKRWDPDGKPAAIAELLAQTNRVLDDMPLVEGNLPTGHRLTVRTGLPTVAWRLLNGGITPSKSTTAQIDEQTGMLEAYSECDVDLVKLNGNEAATRLSEAKAFIESMNQEMVGTLFYGNSGTAPEEFTGLSTRFSSTTAANGENIILGGGAGADNASVWLIGWSPECVFGIYPKASQGGLLHDDLGKQMIQTSTGIGTGRLLAYVDHWQWKVGLALKDWRYVARAPNIDISALVAKSSAADLFDIMIKMTHRIPELSMCRPVFYMNRTLFQMLDIQARDDVQSGGQLKYEEVEGRRVATFRGIPVRLVDQLTEAESLVA
jgi:hypothetical protein